jgi:hypothetical protein
MDDPMVRSRLDRTTGTQPIGAPDPKRGPHLFNAVPICKIFRARFLHSSIDVKE